MGKVLKFVARTHALSAQPQAELAHIPEFEWLFLSNLVVRLGDQGFASLARAISESAANQTTKARNRLELDGLVDLGLTFLARSSGAKG